MSDILYCKNCERYTLEQNCPHCKKQTISRKPARFSPQDHYGVYRRKLKQLQKNG